MSQQPELIVCRHEGLQVAALVQGRRLIDVAVDRPGETRRYQSIWATKIDRILPHVGAFAALGEGAGLFREASRNSSLSSGDALIGQVKSLRGEGKADILTEDIALTGRHFVYLPRSEKIVVSSRLQAASSGPGELIAALHQAGIEGGIVRSHALTPSTQIVVNEAKELKTRWLNIEGRAAGLLEEGPDAAQRLQADYPGIDLVPLPETLDSRGVAEAFEALLNREIPLPRGGSAIIEHTAALTAIDVNAGTRTPADVDREAIDIIAAQIRLRNLSGLILIDFASSSMKKGQACANWLLLVKKALDSDPARCRVAGVTPSGLIEITRPARDLPLAQKLLRS